MKRTLTPNQIRIRRTVAAVLIVAVVFVIVGVILVARCLTFDEQGAHVVDRYGVLALEAQDAAGSAGADSASAQTAPAPSTDVPSSDAVDGSSAQPDDADDTRDDTESAERIRLLSADTLTEELDALLEQAQDGTLTSLMVTLKDSDGMLTIPVETEAIDDVSYITQSNAGSVADGIQQLSDAGVSVIGRIYCFHDQLAAKRNADLAMQYVDGGSWLDYDNTRWLDPTNYDTISYLSDIARSAAEIGCSELILNEFTFPPRGHLDRITFDDEPESQAAVLTEALKDIQSEAHIPVSLGASALTDLTELSENGVEDGIALGEVSDLLNTAHRVFVTTAAASVEDVQQQLSALTEAELVPIFTEESDWQDYTKTCVYLED